MLGFGHINSGFELLWEVGVDVERKLPLCLVLSLSVKSLMQLLALQAPCRRSEEQERRRDASCSPQRCLRLLCLSGFRCTAGANEWKAREAEVNPLGRGELSSLVLLLSHLCFELFFSLRVPVSAAARCPCSSRWWEAFLTGSKNTLHSVMCGPGQVTHRFDSDWILVMHTSSKKTPYVEMPPVVANSELCLLYKYL